MLSIFEVITLVTDPWQKKAESRVCSILQKLNRTQGLKRNADENILSLEELFLHRNENYINLIIT